MKLFILLLTMACLWISSNAQGGRIVMEIDTDEIIDENVYKSFVKDVDNLEFLPFKKYNFLRDKGLFKLTILTNKPVILGGSSQLPFLKMSNCILSPGDSIHITRFKGEMKFTGMGSEIFALLNDLSNSLSHKKLDSLGKTRHEAHTIDDFFNYASIYRTHYEEQVVILNEFKNKITTLSFEYLSKLLHNRLLFDVGSKFANLYNNRTSLKLSTDDLIVIYDSIIERYNPMQEDAGSLQYTPFIWGLEKYTLISYLRSKSFQLTNKELAGWSEQYYYAKNCYKGIIQRKVLAHMLYYRMIEEATLTDETIGSVSDFLTLAGYPQYKEYVKSYIDKRLKVQNEIILDFVTDGPYVMYRDGAVLFKSVNVINDSIVAKTETINNKMPFTVLVNSDKLNKSFEVKLKDQLKNEDCEFKTPSRVIAISDIEGNFYSFYKLLLANKIIDGQFNWLFGDGHLVLVGDFVDRGKQVTEVLWLIYSLEEKAIAKGGYVHFILGNHEIMNLSGQIGYVHKKYKQNAKLLNEDYSKGLYGESSELGRWLRTKNIIVKIGNTLYTHGGISSEVNKLELSLPQINSLVNPYYGGSNNNYNNDSLKILLSTNSGPYWYRGYYKDKTISLSQIDSTLNKFKVNRIVTGHTIIEDGEQITNHFEGKVINIDTHHAKGYTEALLIDRNILYRVNSNGEKTILGSNGIANYK